MDKDWTIIPMTIPIYQSMLKTICNSDGWMYLNIWIYNSLRPDKATWRQCLGHHWFRQWLVAFSHQAITPSNGDVLSRGKKPVHRWIKISQFWFKKMHLQMSCVKYRPYCSGLYPLSRSPPSFDKQKKPQYYKRLICCKFVDQISSLSDIKNS